MTRQLKSVLLVTLSALAGCSLVGLTQSGATPTQDVKVANTVSVQSAEQLWVYTYRLVDGPGDTGGDIPEICRSFSGGNVDMKTPDKVPSGGPWELVCSVQAKAGMYVIFKKPVLKPH